MLPEDKLPQFGDYCVPVSWTTGSLFVCTDEKNILDVATKKKKKRDEKNSGEGKLTECCILQS